VDLRADADEDAAAVLAADQPLGLEDVDRLAGGHAGDAVGLGHGGFARQRVALAVLAVPDRLAKVIGNLPVDGSIARRVDEVGHGNGVLRGWVLSPSRVDSGESTGILRGGDNGSVSLRPAWLP
jgi:hypothetical protein